MRLLGNRLGRSEFSVDPMVCVCGCVGRPDWPVMAAAGGIVGGIGDWITLSEGYADSNEEGRKIRKGTFRNAVAGPWMRMLDIRWNVAKSSVVWLLEQDRLSTPHPG